MGLLRTRNDSTSSHQSASATKKRKADNLTVETTQRKLRASKELKTETNTKTSVISGVKRPPKCRHILVGRLSQHISVTEMEEYCETNGIELLHVRQISGAESQLKSFYCVFRFEDEKVESVEIWPENVTVSRFYLKEPAREWLKSVEKR